MPSANRIKEIYIHITSVDPSHNIVRGAGGDGYLFSIFMNSVPSTAFIWPQVGEFWSIRKENNEWILGRRKESPNDTNPSIQDIPVGEAYLHATAVTLSDGSKLQNTIGLQIKEGLNAKQGIATLVAGTVTVNNTSVTASSRIQLTSQVDGGTPGFLRVSSRIPGASFHIQSSSSTDTSIVAYQISEPAT